MAEDKAPIDPIDDEAHEGQPAPDDPQPSDPARAVQSLVDPDQAGDLDPTTDPTNPDPEAAHEDGDSGGSA